MPNRDHRAELERLLQMTASRTPATPRASRDWFRIENASRDVTDVYIYDAIGGGLFGEGVTARDFVPALAKITSPQITLHLNSPGGEVFDGVAIYNALRSHPAKVIARVEGIAASAASFIAMAGDQILMAPHSSMMIHEVRGIVFGTADQMRSEADLMEKVTSTIANIYQERAGGSVREWLNAMHDTTWYEDQEAVDAGLADAVDGPAAPQNHFDLSHYAHVPPHLVAEVSDSPLTPTERDAERALRDVGLSQRAAKAVLAHGWEPSTTRDADDGRLLAGLLALRA